MKKTWKRPEGAKRPKREKHRSRNVGNEGTRREAVDAVCSAEAASRRFERRNGGQRKVPTDRRD